MCGEAGLSYDFQRSAGPLNEVELSVTDKIFDSHSDILGNLAQKERRDIPARMKRNRGTSSVWMAKLSMGTALSDLLKTQVV